MQRSVDHVRQPFPGIPGSPRLRPRKEVVPRNRVVVQNVLAGPDVPTHVAVGEQPLPSVGAAEEQPYHQRQEEKVGYRWNRQTSPAPGQDRLQTAGTRSRAGEGFRGSHYSVLRPLSATTLVARSLWSRLRIDALVHTRKPSRDHRK